MFDGASNVLSYPSSHTLLYCLTLLSPRLPHTIIIASQDPCSKSAPEPVPLNSTLSYQCVPPPQPRIHAADVLRNLYIIMQRGGVLKSAFPETQELSLLSSFVAAIVHDYDHRGVNNDFLVKSNDPLAVSVNFI